MKRTSLLRAAAALVCPATFSTNAAVSTWTGAFSLTNWNNAANWSAGIPATGDDVTIADATTFQSMSVNDANHTIGALQFGTTGTRNAFFAINGSTTASTSTILTLTNGYLSNYGAGIAGGNLSIRCPDIVGNDQTWTATGTVPATTSDYGLVLTV